MKVLTIFFILLIGGALFAQNQGDTLQAVAKENAFSLQEFFDTYGLMGKVPSLAKTIDVAQMKAEPSSTSESINVIIPKDATIYLYKYFPKTQYWAIRYKRNWGFIPSAKAFSIKQKAAPKCDTPPILRSKLEVKYPESAKNSKIEGRVTLLILVNKKGKVDKVRVKNGIPELNQEAIKAAQNAKFKPATLKGEKIEIWMPLSVDFKLKED